MDLTIETKDYRFLLGTIDMSLVCVFLSSELHFSIDEGVRYMTKKEIQRLIEYLEKTKISIKDLKHFESIIDKFTNMEMLMEAKEKARLTFF